MRRRRRIALVVALVVLAVLAVIWLLQGRDAAAGSTRTSGAPPTSATPTPAAAAPAALIDTATAPAPGMDPRFAPPDGPALDYPPFDVDAVAMRDELRTHGVDLPDDRLYQLVVIADKYIAEDVPDLYAYDGRILRDVRAMWPKASRKTQLLVTKCLAEYVERVIARNHGWAKPPDEDDHTATERPAPPTRMAVTAPTKGPGPGAPPTR
jgi:hypothetical protein